MYILLYLINWEYSEGLEYIKNILLETDISNILHALMRLGALQRPLGYSLKFRIFLLRL